MATTPPVMVQPPAPRGLRYGLLTSANGPLELPEHASGGGITHQPVGCGFARLYPVDCDDRPDKVFDPANPWPLFEPFAVYATVECSSVGTTAAEMEDVARQRLAAGEQTSAEAGFADVLETDAVTVLPGDSDSFRQVVGELEQWLYTRYGYRGFIHAPVRYAALAAHSGLLVPEGPGYRTQLGTVWTFGAGYPDDGRIWATGNTTVWRASDVFVSPAGQVLDRATNTYRVLAEREYVVGYDCLAAVATYTGDAAAS